MQQQLRHQLWIVAAAGVVFFTNLGGAALWDLDEPFYASSAHEMLRRGDWVVPMYNGQMSVDKPPLVFWLMISGFEVFGVTEFAARFWSAALGIGSALATYHLGRIMFRAEVGLWAGLITATTIIFSVSARAATTDSALVFVTTMAMLLFVCGGMANKGDTGKAAHSAAGATRPGGAFCGPRRWFVFALIYAFVGLGVLAKGPVGLLLPLATIGLFLLIVNRSPGARRPGPATRRGRLVTWLVGLMRPFAARNVLRVAWQMRPVTAVLVVGAVALPWHVLVGLRTEGAWLREFFVERNVGAFLNPTFGHHGPLFYHLPVIFIGFFPWSVFLGPTLLHSIRQPGDGRPRQPGHVLLWCWVGVFFVFWSMCSTKLPHHVLPAYPPLAVLTGWFIHSWLAEPGRFGRWCMPRAAGTLVLVGIGILVVAPIVASIYVPGEELIGLVGVSLVVGGGLCLFYLKRGRQERVMTVFALTSVVFLTSIFGWAALRVDRHQNARPLIANIRRASPEPPQMAGFRFLRASIVFYAGSPVPCYDTADQLRGFLRRAEHPYIFTSDEHEAEIEAGFPGEFQVVARRPRFLRSGEVVVLSRSADAGVPRTAAQPGARAMR